MYCEAGHWSGKEYKTNTIKVEMSIPWKAPNPLYDILYNQISIVLGSHMLWTDTLINIITYSISVC